MLDAMLRAIRRDWTGRHALRICDHLHSYPSALVITRGRRKASTQARTEAVFSEQACWHHYTHDTHLQGFDLCIRHKSGPLGKGAMERKDMKTSFGSQHLRAKGLTVTASNLQCYDCRFVSTWCEDTRTPNTASGALTAVPVRHFHTWRTGTDGQSDLMKVRALSREGTANSSYLVVSGGSMKHPPSQQEVEHDSTGRSGTPEALKCLRWE